MNIETYAMNIPKSSSPQSVILITSGSRIQLYHHLPFSNVIKLNGINRYKNLLSEYYIKSVYIKVNNQQLYYCTRQFSLNSKCEMIGNIHVHHMNEFSTVNLKQMENYVHTENH